MMTNRQREYRTALLKYCIGFIVSLVLTFGAYLIVTGSVMSGLSMILALAGLALVQMIVQLIFFLHVAEEEGPRYRLISFGFMVIVLVIVVGGSLWIMYHLNENMMDMSTHEKDTYMMGQRDKGF